jgi:hypothetical protein
MMRLLPGALVFLATAIGLISADAPVQPQEKLTYGVEWKLIHAGTATVEIQPASAKLTLESAGLVSTQFKIRDVYHVNYDDPFCATASTLDASEGKRHHETKITYDRRRGKAFFVERDLANNSTVRNTNVDTPRCVQDTVGALLRLRTMKLDPGQSGQVPMTDGRKSAAVRVEAQARETIKTPAGSFQTVRYEANMLNGVVYARSGRVFVWVSEDQQHLPVRIELRLSFPAGTVTLDLQKAERF